jgi:hypothetical protein
MVDGFWPALMARPQSLLISRTVLFFCRIHGLDKCWKIIDRKTGFGLDTVFGIVATNGIKNHLDDTG